MSVDNEVFSHSSKEMTERDKRRARILLVEADSVVRNSMRHALVSLGFDEIIDASDYILALEKLEEREFTHIIFDVKNTRIPPREFLALILEKDSSLITLPSSFEPTADDVFQLLIAGAKGFIVKPFTAGSLDESIGWATKGDPITDSIRHTQGRNEALAAVVLSSLDKLALVMRQSRKFETAKLEIPRKWSHLTRAVNLARTFAKGGDPRLREALMEAAIERSKAGKARIGAPRKRPQATRLPNKR